MMSSCKTISAMRGNTNLLFLLLSLSVAWTFTHGYDILEGLFQTTACMKPRRMTGCNGTLITNFQPSAPGVGLNPPDTGIFLFTVKNKEEAEFLHECGGSLPKNTNFDPKHKTEVFIHGWFDGACRTAWMREMRDQLFKRGKYNVILVDWSWGNLPDYVDASHNSPLVGQQVAFVLKNIMDVSNQSPDDIHMVGHSFGAHAAGFSGKQLKKWNVVIGRITGLDPALAPFKYETPDERIDKGDAKLVDIIHTDGTECAILVGGGFITPLGHADFYPNRGGPPQWSCYPYIIPSLLKGDIEYALISIIPTVCYHLQAIQYYKVTINPGDCEYRAYECPSYLEFLAGKCSSCGSDGSKCARMGMDFGENFQKNPNESRKYYLETRLFCPYCSD